MSLLGDMLPRVTLHLHRAERTDVLADELGRLLATPLEDPFAQEVVAVPAKGVERWLSQRLSHRLGATTPDRGDGVCAGVRFLNPHSLISLVLGLDHDDPWAPDRLVWPLLSVIDASLGAPWCATLADHLGHGLTGDEGELRRGRRYSVARRLAGLFSSYAVQRPGLVRSWREGDDGDVDADLAWQPELYRRLLTEVGGTAPDQRQAETVQRLRDGDPTLDLPSRLSLFGHTRLPASEIELLQALARTRDLHVWLPHPSPAMWAALAGHTGAIRRADDSGHHDVAHPLLATLSRDVRELQRSLAVEAVDHHHPVGEPPATLLGWLQADLRANQVGSGRTLAEADRSVQVHACHGQARQVDVLRDVLLGLLQDDPTLEPRDILVMCPDIETYAPLITAGFGLGEVAPGGHPAHRLRVRLADRALTQTNPLLGVVAHLLVLAEGRATASQVLDLAEAAPVRRRFGFTDDDLDGLTAWVRESGIRWGFDKEHRQPFGLEDYVNNTWSFGADRVLAGVALSDDSHTWLDQTLPLDDVGSNRVELAGRFAEYVARLRRVSDRLTGTRSLAEWIDALTEAVDLLTVVGHADGWQIGQLQRELGDVLAGAADRELPLRLSDVRGLLAGHLAGRPTRANFRTGTLTVCTMVPMRSVPHRVVCLVGLDDGIFPRTTLVDGDDVLARAPLTGERDVRSEDRQLLLDAIGATTETLVITYTGADEHTGQPRPPAVPLGELLDALDLTTDQPVRERVHVVHPLQPFDARNVTPGKLAPGAFTFDRLSLVAAEAAAGDRPTPPPFLDQPLDLPAGDVALADLVTFFKDPVKGFFRALDVTLPWEAEGVSDAMPVEIDALEQWGVGDRMLRDMLNLIHPDNARQAEFRRGALPPGQLGWRMSGEIRDVAMNLAMAALTHRQVAPRTYDVDVDLGGGRRLTGTVGPVYGDRLVAVGYSRLDGKHLLESWVRLLALAAHDPDHNWNALTIGRAPRGTAAAQRLLGPADEAPEVLLAELVALYDAGRREPLPLPLKTSFAWASARRTGDDPFRAALGKWKGGMFPGEDAEPANVRVWGEFPPIERLMTPPRPGEAYEGEEHRLGIYSSRLWLPLLRNERPL